MQLTQLYSKKSRSTTLPRKSAGLAGAEFSHGSPPSNSGAVFPSAPDEAIRPQPSRLAANNTTHHRLWETRMYSAPDSQRCKFRYG